MITKTHNLKTETHKEMDYPKEYATIKVRLALSSCWQDNAEKWGHKVGAYIDAKLLAQAAIQAYDSCLIEENERLSKALEAIAESNKYSGEDSCVFCDGKISMNYHICSCPVVIARDALGDTHNDEINKE